MWRFVYLRVTLFVCEGSHAPQVSLQRLILNQTECLCISSCPWAALDLNALSPRRWAKGCPPPLPPRTLGRLPACLQKEEEEKKNMSRYFYCSALWSSHRLLKQSPLINIYSLSDGTGSIERGEREERVWIIIIHLNPALSLFSTCLWGRSNGFRQEVSVWARDGKWEDRHDMFLPLFLLQLFFTFVEKCYSSHCLPS